VAYPDPLERLIAALETLPGIGRRTAERLAFHLLRDPRARELGRAIDDAVTKTHACRRCGNVAETDPCGLCSDPEREASIVCVVEGPRDVESMERAGVYRGLYHVLMGALNPVEGASASELAVGRLVERVGAEGVREVILATDPDAEGEATALLVLEALERLDEPPRVTRLARGLPAGSAIEYLHKGVLEDALEERRPLRSRADGRPRGAGSDPSD